MDIGFTNESGMGGSCQPWFFFFFLFNLDVNFN